MSDLWNWITELLTGFANAGQWLITPLSGELDTILGITTTPLFLVSFGGLTIFLTIAIVKWIVS